MLKKTICLLWLLLCIPVACMADVILTAVNVGKADCLILQSGETAYMIDTGTAEAWGAVSRALRTMGISHLDGVIVTHTDSDHAGGVPALAQSGMKIDNWYTSAFYTGVKEQKHPVLSAAEALGQKAVFLSAGDVLPIDGGTLKVLGPVEKSSTEENDNSVVLLFEGEDGSILLTGDMELPEEDSLMALDAFGPVTVLKVSNHGDNDANSEEFIACVRPQIAVICADSAAVPDKPHRSVLSRLERYGADVWRTDRSTYGIRVTLHAGHAEAENIEYLPLPEIEGSVYVSGKSAANDTVTLRTGAGYEVDISGWYMISERGNQLFVFPEGAAVIPGKDLVVSSQSSKVKGDYLWPEKKVWHKTKDDACVLYDCYGREIDRLD